MYPETDVKPVQITEERLNALRARLPEMPEVKLKRFMSEYGLNEKLANQILDSEYLDLFEELSAEDHNTTLIAVTLTEELTRLRRDGVQVDALTNDAIHSAFNAVRDGLTAKESLPSMLAWLSKHPDSVARDALSSLGLEAMSLHDLESIIENVVHEKRSLVADKGMAAMGPLMGIIMGQVRGKAQPRDVQRLLQKVLKAETGTQ
jgi:glutamyl-tRNA(Gln) amidotransferase subunit E